MSAVSTSRVKKTDPLSKKTPANPKYSHVGPTVDTGSSITKYMAKIEEIRKNYRIKPDEKFKRMKITTFVQLLVQVADYDRDVNTPYTNGQDTDRTDRPDTADREVQKIQGHGSPPRYTARDRGAGDIGRESRTTLEQVISGVGEVDLDKPAKHTNKVKDFDCPYLLLDVRDSDSYDQCHIITGLNYPTAMLSRATNYESKEMLAYKNKPGKIIVVYDEDERLAHGAATTLTERFYDNLFLLSGGMRVAYKVFPVGLFTGTPNLIVTEAKIRPTELVPAVKKEFSVEDLCYLHQHLDSALADRSVGSRLSIASTSTSRMGGISHMSSAPIGAVKGRKPFKP